MYFNYIRLIIYLSYALFFYIISCPCNTTLLSSTDSLNTYLFTLAYNLHFTTHTTTLLVLCYKSEGRWFDPSWSHWNFSLT